LQRERHHGGSLSTRCNRCPCNRDDVVQRETQCCSWSNQKEGALAIAEALFKQNVIISVAVGVGVGLGLAVLAPSVFPQTARAARPMAKRAIRAALQAYVRSREGLAEFREYAEDIVAEAQSEVILQRKAAAARAFDEAVQQDAPGPSTAG